MGGELTGSPPDEGRLAGAASLNEAIPRAASSVRATAAKASCSMARPSASVPSSPRSTAALARPWATTGPGRQLGRPRPSAASKT